jgi:putative solute:sodium symporter small subunit
MGSCAAKRRFRGHCLRRSKTAAPPMGGGQMASNSDIGRARRSHWRKTFWLTMVVLIIWFVFSFGVHFYGTELNNIRFLGFPLGFYLAAQGSLIVFVVTIFLQNWIQDAIDNSYERASGEREIVN